MENWVKENRELDIHFAKKYRKCNSTLEKLIVDIDYKSASDKLWRKYLEKWKNK